jgi:NAD-dependent dihydropyrimidine dehydrogenase PreA subunit/flavodoxin
VVNNNGIFSTSTIPLFYFSGTGNTWWVSQRLAESLSARGFSAAAYSIEQVTPEQAADLIRPAAIIGLGFPIYGSDAPRIFHDFMQTLPFQDTEKPVLGYVTQMAWSGDGINFLRRPLLAHGYRLRWAVEINMPNNICMDIFPVPYQSDYARFEPQLARAWARVEKLADRVARGRGWLQNSGPLSSASAWLQRAPFRLVHDWAQRFWSVDAELCTACGLCARQCPAGNIRMENGLPVYQGNCVYCVRCFNYCPELAVLYGTRANRRAVRVPPFKGPVPDFSPTLISRQR